MTAEQFTNIIVDMIMPAVGGLTLYYFISKDSKISKEAKKLGVPYREYKLQLKLDKLKLNKLNGGKE